MDDMKKKKLKDKLKIKSPGYKDNAAGPVAGISGSPGLGGDGDKVKDPKKSIGILVAILKARKKK